MRMTTEEAFVKVLQRHGIEHAFGIIGSAMMPISDLFPTGRHHVLGLRARGQRRHDGRRLHPRHRQDVHDDRPERARASPISSPPVKTAYWNHTPLLLVTPQAANRTIGQGGFQEVEQMALFQDMVCYQEEVRDPSRIAEVLNRVIEQGAARLGAGADQRAARFLDAGDRHRAAADRATSSARRGGEEAIAEAAKLLSEAKFPVILNGAGVVLAGAIAASRRAGRAAGRAGLLRLPAQRRLPGLASAFVRARSATTARRRPWS